jgi:hypothetical protein
MPIFASFEGYETTGRLVFAGWLIALALALLALLLAFSPRTRRASQGFAVACVIASVPVNLLDVFLWAAGGFDLLLGVLYLSWKFAPLIIAVCVFWFDERRLTKNIDLTKLHHR